MARFPRVSSSTTRILLLALFVQAAVIFVYSATRVELPEDPNRAYPEVVERTIELEETLTLMGSGPMLVRGSYWHVGWERIQSEPRILLLDTLGRATTSLRLPTNTDVHSLSLQDVDGDGMLEVLYIRVWPLAMLREGLVTNCDSVWICVRDERNGEVIIEKVTQSSLSSNQVILPDEKLVMVTVKFLENHYEHQLNKEYLGVFVESQFYTMTRRRLMIFEKDEEMLKVAEIPVAQRLDQILWARDEAGRPEVVVAGEFSGNLVGVSAPRVGREVVTRMVRLNDVEPAASCFGLDGSLKWTSPLGAGRYSVVLPGAPGDNEIVSVLLRSAQEPGVAIQRIDASRGALIGMEWYPESSFGYFKPSPQTAQADFFGVLHDREEGHLRFLDNRLQELAEIQTKPSLVGLQELPGIQLHGKELLLPIHIEGSTVSLLFNREGEVRASVPGNVQRTWVVQRKGRDEAEMEVYGDGQLWLAKLAPNDFPLWQIWPYRWLIVMLVLSNGVTIVIMLFINYYGRYRRLRLEAERMRNMVARTSGDQTNKAVISTLQGWLQERRESTQALRMYDAALQSINLAVLNLDLHGIIRSANENAIQEVGAGPLVGRRFSTLFNETETVEEMLSRSPGRGGDERVLTVTGIEEGRPPKAVHVDLHPLAGEGNELEGWLVMVEQRRPIEDRSLTPLYEEGGAGRYDMIGVSPQMDDLYRQIDTIRMNDATVLIVGESGTGKEKVAEALHKFGGRAKGPFVRVNCAALSETLLESELFGHVRGAFTGAYKGRVGRFEAAANGTILLDEIGELPLNLQVKLLRVLQEREIERVGDQTPIKVQARIIAATNQDLEKGVEEGRFRQDLYFRLNVLRVTLPPLRDRSGDIRVLVNHMIGEIAEQEGRPKPTLDKTAEAALERYKWPGNVRELRNCVERAVILAREGKIEMEHLPAEIRNPGSTIRYAGAPSAAVTAREPEISDEMGTRQALETAEWNIARAAKLLGVSRTTIYRNMQKFGIRRPGG